jgi:hypothetical protein
VLIRCLLQHAEPCLGFALLPLTCQMLRAVLAVICR